MIETETLMALVAGATVVPVKSEMGLQAGREIIIEPGTPTQEVNMVSGLEGSLILHEPLKYPHPKGCIIKTAQGATTTAPANMFPHPFPERYKSEQPGEPVGPFAPTFPPTTPSPYGMFGAFGSPWGPGPGPAPAPAPMFGMGTTFRPYMLLDMTSGSGSTVSLPPLDPAMMQMPQAPQFQPEPAMMQMPQVPQFQPEPAMMQIPQVPQFQPEVAVSLPPLDPSMMQLPYGTLPPMALSPVSLLQESLEDTSGLIRSRGPIDGCNCKCAKREAAMMQAQRNAMHLAEFPEEGEPVPWGHAA